MSDLIEREDAIKAFAEYEKRTTPRWSMAWNEDWEKVATEVMSAIPSAYRPQGEWIEDPINKNIMYCSNCKVGYTKDFLRGMSLYHEPKDTPDFCPNCGADMRGNNHE